MGEMYTILCIKCDFSFEYVTKIFFYDGDSIEEMGFGFKACDEMAKSPLSGHLYESYCKECDHIIKRYVIDDSKTQMERMEAICLVSRLIKDKEYSLIEFGREKANEVLFCPKCGLDIPHSFQEIKDCPKCGGQMKQNNDLIITFDYFFDI